MYYNKFSDYINLVQIYTEGVTDKFDMKNKIKTEIL